MYCLQVDSHLKQVKVQGVPEKFPCIIVIVSSFFSVNDHRSYTNVVELKSFMNHEDMTCFQWGEGHDPLVLL